MRWVVLPSGWRVAEWDARERGSLTPLPSPPASALPASTLCCGCQAEVSCFPDSVSSSLWPRLPAEIDSQKRGDPGGCCLPHRHGPLWHGVAVPAGWVVPGMGHSCATRQDRGAPKEHPPRLSSKMARLRMAGRHPPKCQPPGTHSPGATRDSSEWTSWQGRGWGRSQPGPPVQRGAGQLAMLSSSQ